MNCRMCTPEAEGTYICNDCTQKLFRIVQKIGYPRRGTQDESITLQEAANIIQKIWPVQSFQ